MRGRHGFYEIYTGYVRVYTGSVRVYTGSTRGLHGVCEGLHGVYSESMGEHWVSCSPQSSPLWNPQPPLLLTTDQTLDSHHNTFSPKSAFASKP